MKNMQLLKKKVKSKYLWGEAHSPEETNYLTAEKQFNLYSNLTLFWYYFCLENQNQKLVLSSHISKLLGCMANDAKLSVSRKNLKSPLLIHLIFYNFPGLVCEVVCLIFSLY